MVNRENEKNPTYWSVICLHNMVDLAKEATTLRLVLEPIFRYFDGRDHWSPEKGAAQSVLYNMQFWMEKSGNQMILPLISFFRWDHISPMQYYNINLL